MNKKTNEKSRTYRPLDIVQPSLIQKIVIFNYILFILLCRSLLLFFERSNIIHTNNDYFIIMCLWIGGKYKKNEIRSYISQIFNNPHLPTSKYEKI